MKTIVDVCSKTTPITLVLQMYLKHYASVS